MIDTRTDLNKNGEVVQELMKAKLIFDECESNHGQAICLAALGYVIFEFDLRHPRKDNSLKEYCKKKFIEALTHYEKIEHKYGMSFCYEMLHEIKKSLGEHSNQEYINHINLLKLIKEDIKEEKQKFKERLQGAEVSLFIENIYSVDYLESKTTSDPDELTSIVKNVMEKKNLIEKLQEKMSERLGVINNLLANHVIAHVPMPDEKTNSSQAPNIVK